MLRFSSSKLQLSHPTKILFATANNGNKKPAAFTQLSGKLNASSTSPSTARHANPHTFEDETVENDMNNTSRNQTTSSTNNTSASTAGGGKFKPLPHAVASMSDAEFDENVKVLKQIAQKSARSFGIFISGILCLWYARRQKAKQDAAAEEEEEKKNKKENHDDDDDEESWKDLPAAERYIMQMRSEGWPVSDKDKVAADKKKKAVMKEKEKEKSEKKVVKFEVENSSEKKESVEEKK